MKNFFQAVYNNCHVLNSLLPNETDRIYNLRQSRHNRTLCTKQYTVTKAKSECCTRTYIDSFNDLIMFYCIGCGLSNLLLLKILCMYVCMYVCMYAMSSQVGVVESPCWPCNSYLGHLPLTCILSTTAKLSFNL